MFQWQKPVSGDVTAVRAKAVAAGRRWRSELGPTSHCVRPRPLRFVIGPGSSLERLIFAEVRDGHSERIDGDEFVWNARLENEHKVRGIEITLEFAMVGG